MTTTRRSTLVIFCRPGIRMIRPGPFTVWKRPRKEDDTAFVFLQDLDRVVDYDDNQRTDYPKSCESHPYSLVSGLTVISSL